MDRVAGAYAGAGLSEESIAGDWAALLFAADDRPRRYVPRMIATDVEFYNVVLFFHILSVVLAFGPTFRLRLSSR